MNTFTGGTSCDGMDYWTGFSRITNQGSQGEALEMKQEDLKIKGHAMELRVCRRFYE
jgi:acetyl/propionyl-CoA carboxylase alpha subunit